MPSLIRRKASSHGYGVFTRSHITRGTHVLSMSGKVVPAAEVVEGMRAMQISVSQYLVEDIAPGDDGSEPQYLDNYLNHSCTPNLGFTQGDLRLFALRDIDADHELTWDYSTSMNESGWSLPCFCNQACCRGRIQSFCDLTRAQQELLRPVALSYLREI